MTASEFLAWDAQQAVKHEFVRGEVLPRQGNEVRHDGVRHNRVALNVALALHTRLRDAPWCVLALAVKLRIEAADCFYYPDVLVTGEATGTDAYVDRGAVLVVEVISPSTAAFDRGDKFADYRLLPTLREYLLLDPDKRRGDLFRKRDDGLWVLHPFSSGEGVRLESVGLALEAQTLWEDVGPAAA